MGFQRILLLLALVLILALPCLAGAEVVDRRRRGTFTGTRRITARRFTLFPWKRSLWSDMTTSILTVILIWQ